MLSMHMCVCISNCRFDSENQHFMTNPEPLATPWDQRLSNPKSTPCYEQPYGEWL